MSDQQKITGGCLCGAIQYEARGVPLLVGHCHCENCRRSSGAAFATNIALPVEEVTWIKEEPNSYKSSEYLARLFCRHCGSSVAQDELDAKRMWFSVGTLDRPESVTPEFHIFTEEQIPWVKLDDGLPCHAKFPPT